jgi:hypothetical protein
MLTHLNLRNFTVYPKADMSFSPGLNVLVGENGTGKTHLLKLLYSSLSCSWALKPALGLAATQQAWQHTLGQKLLAVFRPEALGRLARRKQGRERCDVEVSFLDPVLNMAFSLATNSRSEVVMPSVPGATLDLAPAYLPSRELMSIYPGFVSVYEGRYLEFEETWRDTCVLLGAPTLKGPREAAAAALLAPLESAMGGKIVLDGNGRFYLRTASGKMEMPLVAEGLRKLAMLARLIANGTLLDQGFLFWGEPEANLNPRVIRTVAQTIVDLADSGIQVFIATHSLFLLRELEILHAVSQPVNEPMYFGLSSGSAGVQVTQSPHLADVGELTLLDESLQQSDRYLEIGV